MPLVSEHKTLQQEASDKHPLIEIEDEQQSVMSFKQDSDQVVRIPMQKLQSMERPTFVGVAL